MSPGEAGEVLGRFSPAVRAWFEERHPAPTRVQALGWPLIGAGRHALLCAPTGSGKTLAAFLHCLDRLGARAEESAPAGPAVVYISPLKALAYDIERNLTVPLAEIGALAAARGLRFRAPSVGVRTGDTSAAARRQQLRAPPDILITTPESLYLLLTSAARETLRQVETVIVDEIHVLAPSKRGAHLALSLERLARLGDGEPQRIGLSATQRPLDEVARYLGGDRPVEIVDAGEVPRIDLEVSVPVEDMRRPAGELSAGAARGAPAIGALTPQERTSLMPAIYREVFELVRAHRSTIVFVNSRRQAERVAHHVNEMAAADEVLAGAELARAHHGSVARAERRHTEDMLARGLLRCIVATSSLELGIDIAAVDLVVQVESPGSVARGLQRIGRAGHAVGAVSRGRVLPVHRRDLLEAAVVCRGMLDGEVEPIRVPRQPLDVLAQQVVAMVAVEEWPVGELLQVIRRAHAYRDLSREALDAVLDMLSGRQPDGEMADLTPRLAWDRAADRLVPRRGARLVALVNGGTIPDRGLYPVHVGAADGPRVGELDEEMVYESRAGETFLLGATTWRIEEIGRDRVIVSPAPGEPGRMPFWHGDRPGRPAALGLALGALVRQLDEAAPEEARRLLAGRYRLDERAAGNLLAYLAEQREVTGTMATDRAITVERFRDELGDVRVCILSPLGGRVHAPWALALESTLEAELGMPVHAMWTDDGVAFRLPGEAAPPGADRLFPDPDEARERVTAQLTRSAMFASRFRENAARALLLPRRRPGARTPLWAQRLRAQQLLGAALRHPSFPVVLETYRELLGDVFDLDGLGRLLADVRSGAIRVDLVDTGAPSPFARNLAFAYTMAFMYEGDAPVAERRAQALALDRALLGELLGEDDLRGLLDAEVMAAVEEERQGRAERRRARDADELEDLLRRVGPLTALAIRARAEGDPAGWIERLRAEARVEEIAIDGAAHLAAAGDPARIAAARGGDGAALEELVARDARARGPHPPGEAAARLGVAAELVVAAQDRLIARGVLVRGGFRPGGSGVELVHADVLRELRRRTLDRLRREVAPVDAAALGRFLPAWHGAGGADAGRGPGGLDRLRAAVRQLAGAPLPLADLEARILSARVADYHPSMLDELGATGEVVWVGAGKLGARDGRVLLFDRERLALAEPGDPGRLAAPGAGHQAVLEALTGRGASFQLELAAASGLAGEELVAVLWDLVWAGLVTNDTFAPLRAWLRGPAGRRAAPRRLARRGPGGVRPSHFAGGGRWSLVGQRARPADPTERALARALLLLDRYGVVSREAALADEVPGGMAALSPVLRVLEETGRARRGYFVAGIDGRQFALPAAIDRLRGDAGGGAVVLAAADPANPYGALLPWPDGPAPGGPRPSRRSGAVVILWRGALAWYLEAGGRSLLSGALEPEALEEALRAALAALSRLTRRRSLRVESIDGAPARTSPLAPLLLACGFRSELRGLGLPGR